MEEKNNLPTAKPKELEGWTDQKVSLLRKRIKNENHVSKILNKWIKFYDIKILNGKKSNFKENILMLDESLANFHFELLKHSSLVNEYTIKMVGVRFEEMDIQDELNLKIKGFRLHLYTLNEEIEKPENHLKSLEDLKEFLEDYYKVNLENEISE